MNYSSAYVLSVEDEPDDGHGSEKVLSEVKGDEPSDPAARSPGPAEMRAYKILWAEGSVLSSGQTE